jgi:hypothetical protein
MLSYMIRDILSLHRPAKNLRKSGSYCIVIAYFHVSVGYLEVISPHDAVSPIQLTKHR